MFIFERYKKIEKHIFTKTLEKSFKKDTKTIWELKLLFETNNREINYFPKL